MFTLRLSSYSGSPGESWLHINVVINWQLSKQGIRWPVSSDRIAGSGVDPSRSRIFEVIRWQVTSFKWSQAQIYFFFFKLYEICCVYAGAHPGLCHYGPALLRFWFQTYLGHQNSASCLKIQARNNLVPRAFPLKIGWGGKRPWHRLVTCPLVHPKILGVIN